MPSVEFQEANITITADEGQDLRKIALKNKVSVYGGLGKLFDCHGFGLCGSDRIKVDPKDCVTPMTWKEKLHLNEKSGIRLACQTKLCGDATVSIAPALAHGEELKEGLMVFAATLVFGGGTLFFIVFMLFELAGKPLF
ncbi:MAG: 2Fe-2S iron-sulfur cluster binding domain-containing protein [Caldithrix sp.]|nr:MAG: 2Fe-2S iron-sulfur cluster binding domain-containing protein [Caldithrix sp.]